jgi:hypothetical protein
MAKEVCDGDDESVDHPVGVPETNRVAGAICIMNRPPVHDVTAAVSTPPDP